jgi:two-component system response regulator YesN
VLVVDDEPFVRLSIASLRPWGDDGFEFVAEAANGAEALQVLAARPEIDIVLLDLSMPTMDGLEFLRRLRGEGPRPPPAVVVLSAHDDYHLVREAFTLGARDYLLKAELDADALRAVLEKAAAGVMSAPERSAAQQEQIVQRRHLEFLKAQLLRDALAAPATRELVDTLDGLGVALSPAFVPCCFWVEDLEAVSRREGEDGLGRFADLAARSLAQALGRFGRGEVVQMSPGHAAVLFAGGGEGEAGLGAAARAFCEDAAEYVGRYLSVRVSFSTGPVCATVGEAAEAYRAARAARTVESRIVVLARRAVRERFADPEFSLEEASARAGVSKNHLSFEFSRETGETFVQYLSRIRIEEAKRLLATTPLMVYEVGERVGYPNVEHFSRVFKKVVGVSPVRFKAGFGTTGPLPT